MTFAAPLGLLGALVIPLVAVVALIARRRRARFAVRHPAGDVLAQLGRGSAWRRALPGAFLVAAALALAVALARPQTVVAVPVEGASVMLVTDLSGSMVADDVSPTRLGAAQSAANAFVSKVPSSLLVGFTGY